MSEQKPVWKDKTAELHAAELAFDHAVRFFQKTVTEMRDAARDTSRAATRLTNARKAMRGKRTHP